jgi:hypothetical protein
MKFRNELQFTVIDFKFRVYSQTDVDGRIILRWIFRKWEGVVGTGWSWLRIDDRWRALVSTVRNFGFQKCGEFLD